MRIGPLPLLICGSLLASCSTISASRIPIIVAEGRATNTDWESVWDPDDLLGHGWRIATFEVENVIEGELHSPVIEVRLFTHAAELREDETIRLRLTPRQEGGYYVCARPGAVGYKCE